jgi:hypothetical protein
MHSKIGVVINKTFLWRGCKIGMCSERALKFPRRRLRRQSGVGDTFRKNQVENKRVLVVKMEDKIIGLGKMIKYTLSIRLRGLE